MEGSNKALAIALDYISLHNFIEDRETQLTGRRVCRSWRNHDAFSGKITSVTLHKLADMQLIPHLFPNKLAEVPLSKRNEDIPVFPNLRNLIVHKDISDQLPRLLYPAAETEVLLQYCKVFDLEFNIGRFISNFQKMTPVLQRIPRISGLKMAWCSGQGMTVDQFFNDLRALTGLTKLVLKQLDARSDELRCLETLSTLETLKHLELHKVWTDRLEHVVECLSLVSRLSSVTRLDLSMEVNVPYAVLVELKSMLPKHAPKNLHSCTVGSSWSSSRENMVKTRYSFEVNCSGPRDLQVTIGKLWMAVEGERESTVSEELLKALQYGPPSQSLLIELNIEPSVADDRFMLNLIGFIGVEKVAINWRFLHREDILPRRSFRVFSSRLSVPLPGVCQVLSILFRAGSGLFRSDFPEQLPYLFPNLRRLTLTAEVNYDFTDLTSLCKLTKLTYLSLNGITTPDDGLMLPPPCFPPSLKSLHVKNLKGISFPTLEHLTRLYFYAPGLCLDSLYSCRAPLKELSFGEPSFCKEVDLHAVASAFPLLEVLEIWWSSCTDYSILSSLKQLQRLTLLNSKHEGSHADCVCSKSLGMLTAVKVSATFY